MDKNTISEVAKSIGAYKYVECSTIMDTGILEVFQTAVQAYLQTNYLRFISQEL